MAGTYHRRSASVEVLASKMQRNQATGTGRIQVHGCSLEVEEPAEAVGQHRGRDTHGCVPLLGLIILL